MDNDQREGSFIYFYGTYLIYFFSLIGLIVNVVASFIFFKHGVWILGIWAGLSIVVFPKSLLGLILLLGQNDIVYMNLSSVIFAIFPRTIKKYRYSSIFDPAWKRYLREIVWLTISLLPVIFLFTMEFR